MHIGNRRNITGKINFEIHIYEVPFIIIYCHCNLEVDATRIPMFLEIRSKFPHVTTSFLEDNRRTRAETPIHAPLSSRVFLRYSGHPFVECSSVFPSPFPAGSRDGRGDRRWSLFKHAPLASPSPSSASRTTCSLPLAIVGARSKAPTLCHPPTHLPRPSGPRATPTSPSRRGDPARSSHRHRAGSRSVSLSATCVPVVSQRSRNKILIIITITLYLP